MSVTAFLATRACFGACVAIYNLIDGDAPDALQEFGVAGGSVFAHYWARRGQKISVDNMCKLLERDLQTHLNAERVADAPAILKDLQDFGPLYIGSARVVSVADLVKEAHGRPEALTTIILERARLALPEDRQIWVKWQRDFADENTPQHAALSAILDASHRLLFQPHSKVEELVVEGLAQASERQGRIEDKIDALIKRAGNEDVLKGENEELRRSLSAALEELAQLKALQANSPGIAAEAIDELDPEKGYKALVAKADAMQAESNKEIAATLRNAGALAFLNDTQDALTAYRRATELEPDNWEGWNQFGGLLLRIGELDEAESAYLRVGKLTEETSDKPAEAASFGNLGILYATRGNHSQAEEAYEKSLAFNQELGNKNGMANCYGNLGILYASRGNLNRAEEAFRKSLDIDTELGRKEGIANGYGDLGNLYRILGDLERAEEAFGKSLAFNQELGHKSGMASCYGSLGVLHQERGNFDCAEKAYKKSLAIEIELGRKEGMAQDYGNLGSLYRARGELNSAQEAFETSLNLSRELGYREGMASQHGNLGLVHAARGEQKQACDCWQKARRLFAVIGMPHMVEKVEGWMHKAGCNTGDDSASHK